MMPAVYPSESVRRAPARATGCPAFTSKDSVLNRPEGDPARPSTVAPGLYEFAVEDVRPATGDVPPAAAKYQVVWWDPHVLQLGASSSLGLRRDDLIVKDGDMFAVEEGLIEYERWRDTRAAAVKRSQSPSVRLQTATAWAAAAAESGIDDVIAAAASVEIVALPGVAGRPRGPRFGTLVHAVLATVPLDATTDTVRRTAETHGRVLLATSAEVDAAIVVVSSVLHHDIMRRARASTGLKRETPVTWLQDDGTMIEGVLDLAFDENGGTVIVDFKTDHELAAGESRYRAQVQQYVIAVARATSRPVTGVLFRV
jgi:hypothetical protein